MILDPDIILPEEWAEPSPMRFSRVLGELASVRYQLPGGGSLASVIKLIWPQIPALASWLCVPGEGAQLL